MIENGAFKEFVAAVSNSTPMPPRASRSRLCEKVNIVSYGLSFGLVSRSEGWDVSHSKVSFSGALSKFLKTFYFKLGMEIL